MKTKNKNVRKFSLVFLGAVIFSVFFAADCAAIDAWPGGAGTTIATISEPSGIVWHEGRQTLFVVEDSGTLKEISAAGTTLHSWPLAATWPLVGIPDLEGITIAEDDRYLYIGNEHPDSIVEFDLETGEGELTGKYWDLTTWMTGADNSGLEGLAYRNGYFLAGLQADGKVYIFDVNLAVNGDVSEAEPAITPNASYTDISGLDYNSETGMTYAIFDGHDALIELNTSNGIAEHYSLPNSLQQEGFALKTNCMSRVADAYVANDDSGTIVKYSNYPITCLDADSDGVNYTSDCDDYDASISANQNYYRDADSDGLGASTATAFCSLTAPAGYVTNSSDQNDNDFDNDGSAAGIDCNDADNSISQNQIYYRDADGDGLGDAFTSTESCSLAATLGYVTNSSDPADISDGGRFMQINGKSLDLFGFDPTTSAYADLNYYGDDWHEIIAVGLAAKKAYITVVRVRGDEVMIAKRRTVKIKKKHKTVSISTQLSKNKFTTRFSRGKKYTWKVASSGSFKKSK